MAFQALLARLAECLDQQKIPYMVIGGQAVLVHGEMRLTQDVDITLGIPPFDPAPLLKIVAALDLEILVTDIENFLKETFVMPVRDRASGIRVDLICSLSQYETDAIGRSLVKMVNTVPVKFVGVEDLIVHKIIAGRPRDLEDVKGILLKNPKIDRSFIVTCLREHDVQLDTEFETRFAAVVKGLEG